MQHGIGARVVQIELHRVAVRLLRHAPQQHQVAHAGVPGQPGHQVTGQLGRADHPHMQQAGPPATGLASYTPRSALSRPEAMAAVNSWWSRSFWSA